MTKRDLHLVDEPEPNPDALREGVTELRALFGGGALDPMDHEALLALALGGDVADEPALEGERREAERLRAALDAADQGHPLAALAASLRFAARCDAELEREEHEVLVLMSVKECDGLPSEVGRLEAAELRRALEGAGDHPLAGLAQRLRSAVRPRALDELAAERLLRRAFHSLDDGRSSTGAAPRRAEPPVSAQRRWWPIASGLAALAAGVALLVAGPLAQAPERVSAVEAPQLTESDASPKEDARQAGVERSAPRAAAREDAPVAAGAPEARPARGGAPSGVTVGRAQGVGRGVDARTKGSAPAAEFATEADGVAAPVETPAPPRRLASAEVPLTDSAGRRLSRSTSGLFDPATPFSTRGGESERLERIVASRAADLRANRFASWGLR